MAGWVDGKTFSALLKTLQRDQTLSKEPTVFWNYSGIVREMMEETRRLIWREFLWAYVSNRRVF